MQNNIHLNQEEIAIYAEELASGSSLSLSNEKLDHVKDCDECAQAVIATSEILISTINQKSEIPEKETKTIPLKSILGIAASIAALAILTVWYTQSLNETTPMEQSLAESKVNEVEEQITKPEKPKTVKATDVQKSTPIKQQAKPDLTSNKDLDQLVERFNGVAFRGDDLEIITPSSIKTPIHKDVKLEWNNKSGSNLIIEIINNDGNAIDEFETTKSSIQVQLSKPGYYYWKLMNDDFDLLYCGRILAE